MAVHYVNIYCHAEAKSSLSISRNQDLSPSGPGNKRLKTVSWTGATIQLEPCFILALLCFQLILH